MKPLHPKKRQRVTNPRHPSAAATAALVDSLSDKSTTTESSQKLRRTSSHPVLSSSSSGGGGSSASAASSSTCFNDPNTADVVLRLFLDPTANFFDFFAADDSVTCGTDESPDVQIYLHSQVLNRAKYFSALLSDRWKHNSVVESSNADSNSDGKNLLSLKLGIPPVQGYMDIHLTVLELLYTDDFSTVIKSASTALDILPVAMELLFEDCVTNCVKFLEAVPWTEEEEKRVIRLVPLLSQEESEELLARLMPEKDDLCEEMLHGLILSAMHSHPNLAFVKAFVAKLLREFSSRESARRVLENAFGESLKIVKESLEEYSSPDFRGDHNETEAIQRLHLHTALTNGKHLLWLVERMIELKVADSAVKEWSEQSSFTANLQRAFRDDAWRNIVPGLPAIVVRCTSKLALAVANGTIVAARQVRTKLVKDWLPVLIVCKDNVSPMSPGHKSMYMELEETFLRIISTLPMPEAQELLQQCVSFSTRNVEDCPHLVGAFNTWFRRAMQSPWKNTTQKDA